MSAELGGAATRRGRRDAGNGTLHIAVSNSEMGVVFYVVVALLIILLLILLALVHAGYFYALRIRTSIPASAPRRIAYKLYKGPYSKSARLGYGHLMKLAPNSKAVAIYYDDPELVRWFNLVICLLN